VDALENLNKALRVLVVDLDPCDARSSLFRGGFLRSESSDAMESNRWNLFSLPFETRQ
jgi:cellulose biosynthesis protein BcsQ